MPTVNQLIKKPRTKNEKPKKSSVKQDFKPKGISDVFKDSD